MFKEKIVSSLKERGVNIVAGAPLKLQIGVTQGSKHAGLVSRTRFLMASTGESDITDDAAHSMPIPGGGVLLFTQEFSVNLSAKIIKVSFNGKYAGAVLTLTDLEMAYLQQGMDSYTVTLQLQ